MSRVGKHIVSVPQEISVSFSDGVLNIRKGTVKEIYSVPSCLSTEITESGILFKPLNTDRYTRSIWGTTQRNVSNVISGLTKDFTVNLKLSGVGYKATVKGGQLNLQLGFSHDVIFNIPSGVKITCPDATTIVVSGQSKKVVGDVASALRQYRKSEPYKGKGVIRQGEFVYRKEGKKK